HANAPNRQPTVDWLTAPAIIAAARWLSGMEDQMATPAPATFAQLLAQAVHEPGILSSAYRQFYGYSLGNVLLALSQYLARGIQPGPIATFQRWKELGRFVRRGEKAITLCRPVTVKRTTTADDGTEETTAATWLGY